MAAYVEQQLGGRLPAPQVHDLAAGIVREAQRHFGGVCVYVPSGRVERSASATADKVQRLHGQGVGVRVIAQRLQISERYVRQLLRSGADPSSEPG